MKNNELKFDATPTITVRELLLQDVPRGRLNRYWLHLVRDGLGMPVYIPVMIVRGKEDGPVLGLTAAVHGNDRQLL